MVFARDGCTTTCIMITPPAASPKGVLHWPTVLLLSKTLPELISLISFTALGVIVLPRNKKEIIQKKTKPKQHEEKPIGDIPALKVDRFFKQEEILSFLSLAVNISKFGIQHLPGKEEDMADQCSHKEHSHPCLKTWHITGGFYYLSWFCTCSHRPYYIRSHNPDWIQKLQTTQHILQL